MKRLFALAIVAFSPAAMADYLGILRAPQSILTPPGVYSFASRDAGAPITLAPSSGMRLKLGYKYSRYFAVEGEFNDFLRPADVFANPASFASAFRSTGFAVDTVATLPVWRFSFYGRMGAYHGDRVSLAGQPVLLAGDAATRGTRWRYGLGVRYDFTPSLGIRAELERHSLGLGSPLAGDGDADQLSVGISWRF